MRILITYLLLTLAMAWVLFALWPSPDAPREASSEGQQEVLSAKDDGAPVEPSPASPLPQTRRVATAFERIEQVPTSPPVSASTRAELDKFAFPAVQFNWDGPPANLAPAFLWEKQPGEFWAGSRKLDLILPADQATLSNYAPGLAIVLSGTPGRLRIHYNVLARLHQQVQETSGVQNQPLQIHLSAPKANEVVLRLLPSNGTPGRTYVVGL